MMNKKCQISADLSSVLVLDIAMFAPVWVELEHSFRTRFQGMSQFEVSAWFSTCFFYEDKQVSFCGLYFEASSTRDLLREKVLYGFHCDV
jgi:hypothetical protein